MSGIEMLYDIVGVNTNGEECHPFKGLKGSKRGLFSATLSSENTSFQGYTENQLRKLVEDGAFESGGRIRMVPKAAKTTSNASALHPIRYKGKRV